MNLNHSPFELIKKGQKRVEMRLYDEKRRQIKQGDTIEFTSLSSGEKLLVKVLDIKVFKNFEELYKNYDKTLLGYLKGEKDSPSDMLEYYSLERIRENGVCAIEIELI
ncbi:MAG: ASCH domain-containing protein [Clostridia bacterium]|nr:ASCH domain-containing protein [Clostridia bacterium]